MLRGGVALLALVAFGLVGACSGEKDRSFAGGGGGTDPYPNGGGPCLAGQTRACGIELGSANGVVDCAQGTQACSGDGTWGSCMANGTVTKKVAAKVVTGTPGLSTQTVGGSSTTCADNPCNPYCQTFNDQPDSGITTDSNTVISPGTGVSLAETKNIPGGFKNKGSLDSWCGTADQNAACQFDQHCVGGVCAAYVTNEKGCAGTGKVDITAPPVCTPEEGSTARNLTICNRGDVALTQEVQCMAYSGNSPQYPEDSPGVGTIVLQTGSYSGSFVANALAAGACRTFTILNAQSVFGNAGTVSVMCNPPTTAVVTTSNIIENPQQYENATFTDPANALTVADSVGATASFASGLLAEKPATTVVSSTGWTTGANITSTAGDLYAAAAFTDATLTGVTPTSAPYNDCAGGSNCEWYSGASAATNAQMVTAMSSASVLTCLLDAPETAEMDLTGYSFSFPAGSTLTGMTVRAKASSIDANVAFTARVFASKAASDLWLAGTGSPLGFVTVDTAAEGSGTVDVSGLTTTNASSIYLFADGYRTNGGGTKGLSLDYVVVDAAYAPAVQEASMVVGGFGSFGTPSGTLTTMDVDVRWKSSLAANSGNETLYAQAYKPDGVTPIGAEKSVTLPAGTAANTAVTSTLTWTAAELGADLAIANFGAGFTVKLRTTRTGGSAMTVSADWVKVRLNQTGASQTAAMTFKNFGFTVPSVGASNVRVLMKARVKGSGTFTDSNLTIAAYGGAAGNTLLGSGSFSSIATTFTDYATVAFPTSASDVTDANLRVVVSGGINAGGTNPWTMTLDNIEVRMMYDGMVGASVAECNASNNWTVSKSNPDELCTPTAVTTYPPWTETRVFDGQCPAGSVAQWKRFGYTTTTPAGTSVEFRFRTFARNTDGTCPTTNAAITSGTTPAPLATATLSPDTQVCSVLATGTGACPVLLTSVGTNPCLQMDAYGIPAATPPAAPTLTDWRVTYDCIPQE